MARFSDSEIDQLKSEVSVERLVEAAGIVLKKSGKDRLGRCPFHADGEPSLVVTPAKNLWHCFGCQIGGGPIDWVMKFKGVSFRHAVELLKADLPLAAGESPIKRATVRSLPAPVDLDADDQTLLNQAVDYYHETLLASPEALAYLQARGLDHPELVGRFKLGFANRTLGLRLPEKNRLSGADIRARLQKVGIYRESGHEHFNGSLIVPVFDEAGNVTEVYGRKVRDDLRKGTPLHLYLPGPHRGVWNESGLANAGGEVILCEALIDAMTFWCAGFTNVTAAYGVEGFTDDHLAAFQRYGVTRVLIAYDRDEAGDRAAEKLGERLIGEGIEALRVHFPKGMDANSTARKMTPPQHSLGLMLRQAEWIGRARVEPEPAPAADPVLPLAADLPEVEPPPAGDELLLDQGDRQWRIRGWKKNLSPEQMRVNLQVRRVMEGGEDGGYHVDTLDLYAARGRAAYIRQAAIELGLPDEAIKRDIGHVLMKLESLQDDLITLNAGPKTTLPAMSAEDERAALDLLQGPDLMRRIASDMERCGVVGEANNLLAGYLAAVSRKLDTPLAILIQSSSAAGKSSLMDAVLAMVPPEEKVQYSAMTGQSLFYLGETDMQHKILAIAEEEGVRQAAYALKLLQSDGELTMASTGKDEASGNLVTKQYKVKGPVMLMMTTTAIDIDEELMNRCLVLSVNESREQTRLIHERQRMKQTLEGLLASSDKEALIALHQNAQRLLKPVLVVNPYADQLTFLDDKTRTRRDHMKYLTLIRAIALIHQHQRPIKTVEHRGRSLAYIEATKADIALANQIAHEVLGRTLDELPPQTRRLLSQLQAWVVDNAKAQALPVREVRFTRKQARDALHWGDTQLKLHLARLADLEYLAVHRRGTSFDYELVYDGQGDGKHLCGLLDVTVLGKKHGYDGDRSGYQADRSGSGRPPVGPWSGAGRGQLQGAESLQPRALLLDEGAAGEAFVQSAIIYANGAGPVVAGE
ncbi:CHC2 zinc finger domain-containing protein [Pseudoduganella sp. R-34]|uniref:CHC2 zinc finger domain-containing protein n=1 Tax=Pseudoduganella sp. R-34 TaxID=3404062 RepID=UPI003CEDFF73